MRLRISGGTTALLAFTLLPLFAAAPAPAYSIKIIDSSEAPKEVSEAIRKVLAERCVQMLNAKGDIRAEVWLRNAVEVHATEAQIANGLTYAEVPESSVLGVIRFPNQVTDYRNQKIPAGVYTMRLAIQPMEGDHLGTAPYREFALLSPVAEDKTADTMEAKTLQEMSGKTTGGHPGVLLLFPGKGAEATPKLEKKEENHWILLLLLDAKSGDKKATLPIGLTLLGVSSSV